MYTQTDLTQVKDAILKLANGKRVVTAVVQGKTVSYQQTTLKDLYALEKRITAYLNKKNRHSTVYLDYSKGL